VNTFEIKIAEERDMLRMTLSGLASHAHLLRAVAAVITETKARGIWHVLCDATAVEPPLGAFERFEAGVEFARAAGKRIKLVVVARADIVDHVFENVARNRGASVAVFTNEVAALQWLRSTETS
jgi:hypothetical protein